MIDKETFLENRTMIVEYWFGAHTRSDRGTATFFSSELPDEPYTRYDGIILSPLVNVNAPFPTELWIPFENVISVTYQK